MVPATAKISGAGLIAGLFRNDDQRLPDPPEEKIAEILTMLEKSGGEALNCSECGYATCREFAIDIGKGTYQSRNVRFICPEEQHGQHGIYPAAQRKTGPYPQIAERNGRECTDAEGSIRSDDGTYGCHAGKIKGRCCFCRQQAERSSKPMLPFHPFWEKRPKR